MNIRRKETPVSQLEIGMYVCELDRPWLGTPFLLEGLLLESQEEIDQMANICQIVYVDHTISIGKHYIAPPKRTIFVKKQASSIRIDARTDLNSTPKAQANQHTQAIKSGALSFYQILKEIKASNAEAAGLATQSLGHSLFYTQPEKLNDDQYARTPIQTPAQPKNIKMDIKSFFSNLTGRSKKEKFNDSSTSILENEARKAAIELSKENTPVESEIAVVYEAYEQSQIITKQLFQSFAEDKQINLSDVNEVLDSMVESIERNADALIWLSKLKQTDNAAYNHALNVSITLMALANFISLPKKQVKEMGLAGLLQDIGKAKLPQDLLLTQERANPSHFELFKKHVDYSLEMLESAENIPSTVILTVSQHHERLDGSGYPYKLMGKQISLSGQMAGLVDAYCAMTTDKVYAKGVFNQEALELMQNERDITFSGTLIDHLIQFLGIYPVSSLVELNSGEVGVVIQQNTVRRLLPRVMVLLNPDKTKNDHPPIVDLLHAPNTPAGEPYKILRGLPPGSYGLNAANYYA